MATNKEIVERFAAFLPKGEDLGGLSPAIYRADAIAAFAAFWSEYTASWGKASGKSKVRGDSSHYSELGKLGVKSRKAIGTKGKAV